MEFTLESIHQLHKLYTGPDFPKLIQEFKLMGMITNMFNLETGNVTYISDTGEILLDDGIKVDSKIPESATHDIALLALQRNQKGETDFPTFCREIAKAGVYKWVSDLEKMTCSYYDRTENQVIVEDIPKV